MAGSIDFNGSTSKAEHATANVFNGVAAVTACFWLYSDGQSTSARLLNLPEGDTIARFLISRPAGAPNQLNIFKDGTVDGIWTFPITDGAWHAVAVRLDYGSDANDPTVRVDFANVAPTETSAPSAATTIPAAGYCVGNRTNEDLAWDGRLAYMQVFNAIKSDADCDQALRSPGSVTADLRLYLPMTHATDILDQSGNGFDAIGTALATGSDGPLSNLTGLVSPIIIPSTLGIDDPIFRVAEYLNLRI